MSVQALSWVLEHSDVKGFDRLVLIAIANHADADGNASWPSAEKLAHEARIDRRSVFRSIQRLEERGHVKVDHGGGRRKPNTYSVVMETVTASHGNETVTAEPETVTATRRNGDRYVTGTVLEPSIEPSSNPPSPLCDFEDFWRAYPRRVGRLDATKAWNGAVRIAPAEVIVAGAERFAADPNREEQFTPHPATWLRAGRWDDPPLPTRTGSKFQRSLANISDALGLK